MLCSDIRQVLCWSTLFCFGRCSDKLFCFHVLSCFVVLFTIFLIVLILLFRHQTSPLLMYVVLFWLLFRQIALLCFVMFCLFIHSFLNFLIVLFRHQTSPPLIYVVLFWPLFRQIVLSPKTPSSLPPPTSIWFWLKLHFGRQRSTRGSIRALS